MKIKKIFQGSIPANKILNSHSTSQTDTYSCEKINEITENLKIEKVVNNNGTAIKFPDGTMICYSQGVAGYYDSASKVYVSDWTFPAAFISKPVVVGNTLGGNSKTYSSIFGVFVTHVVIQTKCFGINGAVEECDRSANCIAIGRWK